MKSLEQGHDKGMAPHEFRQHPQTKFTSCVHPHCYEEVLPKYGRANEYGG